MTKPINHVRFGTLTAEQWKAFALPVTNPYTRGGNVDSTPYDPRLGALENGKMCRRCGCNNHMCPGHFGYIILAEPCFNPKFMEVLLGILNCVCNVCSSPRLDIKSASWLGLTSFKKFPRLRAFRKKSKNIAQCPKCSSPLSYFYFDAKKIRLRMSLGQDSQSKSKSIRISAKEANQILEKITDETMDLLGFNDSLPIGHPHRVRPESFIFSVLPVIPPCARPWVMRDQEKRDDDLTEKYNTILKLNEKLVIDRELSEKKTIKDTPKTSRKPGRLKEAERCKIENTLQYHVWTLISNAGEKSKSASGRVQKGFEQRLIHKEGHILGNAGSKRVDFSARTVIISGGEEIPAGCMGVPVLIASKQTLPELVVEYNKSYLQNLLDNAQINTITRGGNVIDVATVTDNYKKPFEWRGTKGLLLYDNVERKLQDGDIFLLNRQPTLRLESIQGMRIKILRAGELAFRISLGNTKVFNADFDGDEMNIHNIQGIGGRVESGFLMNAANNLISRQACQPVSGCTQNTLIFFYLITNSFQDGIETYIEYEDFCRMVMGVGTTFEELQDFANRGKYFYPNFFSDNFFKKVPLPGKLVASLVLPRDLSWKRMTNINPNFPLVKISHGILEPNSGPLCRKSIGPVRDSLIQVIWKTWSPTKAMDFITACQFMTYSFLNRRGFSMGISDCLPTDRSVIDKALCQAKLECQLLLENKGSKSQAEYELEINNVLNKAMAVAPKLAQSGMNKGDRNSIVIMKECGAKGSHVNGGQIAGFVGQQNLDGKRIEFTVGGSSQAILFRTFGDKWKEACSNSIHLIDETDPENRRVMGCVGATRTLSCFLPGDQSWYARGFADRCFLQGLLYYQAWMHKVAGRRGVIATALKTSDSGYAQKRFSKMEEDVKGLVDGSARDASGYIIQYMYGDDGMNAKKLVSCRGLDFPFFINLDVEVDVLNTRAELKGEAVGEKRKLTKPEIDLLISFIQSGCPGIQNEITERVSFNTKTILRILLSLPDAVTIYESLIPEFCARIKNVYEDSKIEAGEMIGLISACAIGEITTQLTLNVFHSTGLAAKDVTLGVPRLKELSNASKKPSKTTCTAILEGSGKSLEDAAKLANEKIVCVTVQDVIKTIEIKYLSITLHKEKRKRGSPVGLVTFDEYEQGWWNDMALDIFPPPSEIKRGDIKWAVVITFDLVECCKHNLTLPAIAGMIEKNSFGSKGTPLYCIASPTIQGRIDVFLNLNEIVPFVQDKISLSDKSLITESNIEFFCLRDVAIPTIKKTQLSGIHGITHIFPRVEKNGETIIDVQVQSGKPGKVAPSGASFSSLLAIKGINFKKTTTDNLWHIYQVLGIEAARKFLINEMIKVLSFDGTYINHRHVSLVVDFMTRTGTIKGVNRDGISRDVGPIAKGLFEKAVDNMAEASFFAETDYMKGVSASVMFGMTNEGGTGIVEVKEKDSMPCKRD